MNTLFISIFVFLLSVLLSSPTLALAVEPLPPQSYDTSKLNENIPEVHKNQWVVDAEVTETGKSTAEAGKAFDKTLSNRLALIGNNWIIALIPLTVFIFISAAIYGYAANGKGITSYPKQMKILLLSVLTYTALISVYIFLDSIQGLTLAIKSGTFCPPDCITQKELLSVGWESEEFIGLRLLNDTYNDDVTRNLLLVKQTALVYWVTTLLLSLRDYILIIFFFVSPLLVIPLLTNTTVSKKVKFILKTFLVWLLYAPVLALVLLMTVNIWKNVLPQLFLSLQGVLDNQTIWPTVTNILIGYPGQTITPLNHINTQESYIFYIVTLISFWISILLPWVISFTIINKLFKNNWKENKIIKKLLVVSSEPKRSNTEIPVNNQ